MHYPTLAELRSLCAGPAVRALRTVRLEVDGDILIAFVRTLNTIELDAFDLAVAAGASPRAELVGRALYDPVDPPPDRRELIREIGGWPGWITDAIFAVALEVNHLGERAYRTHAAAGDAPEEGVATPTPAPKVQAALARLEAERERTVAELLARAEGQAVAPDPIDEQREDYIRELVAVENAQRQRHADAVRAILEPKLPPRAERQAEVTARVKGVMGTLAAIGAFKPVDRKAEDA